MSNTINKKSAQYNQQGGLSYVSSEAEDKADYISEKLKEMNNQILQLKKMSKTGKKSAASNIAGSFNPTLEMNKIACATTPAQLRRYIAGVNAKISLLKKAGGYDTLIKRFKKIISKAEEKITNLKYEEALEKKAKELERLRELEASKKIRERKETAKRNRKLKETEDVKNADAVTFVADGGGTVSDVGVEASIQNVALSVSAPAAMSADSAAASAPASVDVTA